MNHEICQVPQSSARAGDQRKGSQHVARTAVIAVDIEGRVTNANGRAQQILGLDLVELMGVPVQDSIADPELRAMVVCALIGAGPIAGWVRLDEEREALLSVYGTPVEKGKGVDAGALVFVSELAARSDKANREPCSP
jgi:PAS domain S-box-containing protein